MRLLATSRSEKGREVAPTLEKGAPLVHFAPEKTVQRPEEALRLHKKGTFLGATSLSDSFVKL